MRPPVGLPRLSRRSRILLVVGVVLLAGLVTGSRLLDTYVSWLWFGEIGFRSVFTTVLLTRLVLLVAVGVGVGGLLAVNLIIAYRTRPVFVPVIGSDDPVSRYRSAVVQRIKLFGIGLPLLVAVIVGATAQNDWQVVQLFLHSTPFGISDPEFHNDISFYAFQLPFWNWLLSWLFMSVAVAFLGSLVSHYLFGGIRLAGRGGQLSGPARMHLALLAGLFVLLKAVAYFFDRYGLLLGNRNQPTGASYTDLNAVLPAKLILLCIAVFCALAFFVGAFMRNLQLPAIATVLLILSSVLVGAAWPAVLEQFSVKPNANDKEAMSIQRNIDATRQAYGITGDKVNYVDYAGRSDATPAEVKADQATIPNVRLLDPNILSPTFTQKQQRENFYGFPSKLNIDRYTVNGKTQDYIVAVREINPSGLADNQKTWINRHLVYTHGNGFVAAPANTINSALQGTGGEGGYPVFTVSDLSGQGDIKVDQPRIYYGQLGTDYAIVGGKSGEAPGEFDTSTNRKFSYNGSGGVPIGNWWNRLAFATHYGERNILFSGAVGGDSRIMYNRDPRQRVSAAAPWLSVDGDPYPAVVDGRVKWIVDGYTTLDSFPYSQKKEFGQTTEDSLPGTVRQPNQSINYIRNSVKATVDAYDGTVALYQVDNNDPVLKAWMGVFPGVVQPSGGISDSLRSHFRYPEDLFKVQRDLLSQYHVASPQEYFSAQTFWNVPADPTKDANNANAPKQPPYYVLAQAPGQPQPTFQITSALTGLQRQNLAAWVSASSDPKDYGKLTVLKLTNNQIDGPIQVQNRFESTDKVTENRTLFNNASVSASFGNLLTLPVAGGLLYVEPLYIQRKDANAFPQLARVLVSFGGKVGFDATLAGALDQVFGAGTGDATTPPGQTSTAPTPSSTPSPTTSSPPGAVSQDMAKAVDDISSALQRIRSAQQAGDFLAMGQAYKDLDDASKRFEAAKAGLTPPASQSSAPVPTPTPTR